MPPWAGTVAQQSGFACGRPEVAGSAATHAAAIAAVPTLPCPD